MKRRVVLAFSALMLVGLLIGGCRAADVDASTLTRVGQAAPTFTIRTLDGAELNPTKLKGKVVLVNFFATWCGPCMAEMPHLEKEVWQRFKDQGLMMVAVGREHTREELLTFRREKGFTFPMAADPKREVYGKFASEYIPRTYVIKADGTIAFQSVGYADAEFHQLVAAVEKELAR